MKRVCWTARNGKELSIKFTGQILHQLETMLFYFHTHLLIYKKQIRERPQEGRFWCTPKRTDPSKPHNKNSKHVSNSKVAIKSGSKTSLREEYAQGTKFRDSEKRR